MIGFAAVFGVLAVFIAQVWLNNQADKRARSMETKPVVTQTIVVAKEPLRFGTELKAAMLREIPWPEQAIPTGAFRKIADVLSHGRRVVLTAIEANEPILAVKITGPGQRATLSALVKPGMKAVTVRVNDVEGVGGFVQPGDRVDVVLTRQIDKGSAATQVVLQDVRVLAVDQKADERAVKPAIPKSVTLEVSTIDAQKVWLAASVGSLSLLLRQAGDTSGVKTHKITLKDLASNSPAEGKTATVVVVRASSRQSYTVPAEGDDGTSAFASAR
jgi:pilus assembly protein CpaB